jgi:hypothetical protein
MKVRRSFVLACVVFTLLVLVSLCVTLPWTWKYIKARILSPGQYHFSFYGKVVDQDGKPVAGYQLRCILHYYDIRHGPMLGMKGQWLTTDDQGIFHYDSKWDRGTAVALGGAEASEEGRRNPGFFLPVEWEGGVGYENQKEYRTPDHPVIVKVIRLGPPTSLIMFWTDVKLPMGFRSLDRYVSVLQGQITAERRQESDFRVLYEIREENGYRVLHYSVTTLGDGGVQQVTGPDSWRAPEDGYVQSLELKPIGNEYRVFFNCHNRQVYGILIITDNHISCHANPRGMRNLYNSDKSIPTPVTLPYKDTVAFRGHNTDILTA